MNRVKIEKRLENLKNMIYTYHSILSNPDSRLKNDESLKLFIYKCLEEVNFLEKILFLQTLNPSEQEDK